MGKVYVVTMHRWGSMRLHTYAVGAYRSLGMAHLHGEMEVGNRGGCKYDYRVTACPGGPPIRENGNFVERHGRSGDAFMRKLAIKRSMNWYKAGDYARFGGM